MTQITKERLAVFNKKLKHKIRFEIIDLKDKNGNASGTKVVFEIPLSLYFFTAKHFAVIFIVIFTMLIL